MIFRRFLQRLKQHQWGAIATELAIVIIGVFIGIQVSNWNEERETNQQAAVFTAHLKADLRQEDWRYQLMISYNRQVSANAVRAVDALDGKALLPDEDLLVSAYRATQYRESQTRRGTYDELISTGTIALIHDPDLRDTAMRYYSSATIDNLVNEGRHSRYREAFRMALPIKVQRVLGKQCGDKILTPGDYAGIPGVLNYPCRTGLSGQDLREAVAALRSNPAIVPALRLRIIDLDTRIFDLTVNNSQVLGGLRAIAKEKP